MEAFSLAGFVQNFLHLFTESAPFLLVGLVLAGIIHEIVPKTWIEKTLGKNSSVITAAFIGAPVPLCSCSVIPTAMGIRRAGASKASTASFMVATPETGVDSIGVTFALMGPIMAIVRPISAVLSAISAGLLVRWWDVETPPKVTEPTKGCCSSKSGCNSKKNVKTKTIFSQKISIRLAIQFREATGRLHGLVVDRFVLRSRH